MVAVMGGEPEVMLDKALEALGGIGNFVKKGQKIVIKPNIGWDRSPELAGNTNPKLVKALVKKCLEAGASKVTVFDTPAITGRNAMRRADRRGRKRGRRYHHACQR